MTTAPRLTVIIPTLNAQRLSGLLKQLEGGADGIIVSDGGSSDMTLRCAVQGGAGLACGDAGRGVQLARGADWAAATLSPDWYLFLHSDVRLPEGWVGMCRAHMQSYREKAGYFALRFDSEEPAARLAEKLTALRGSVFALPYGDQGLLITRALYEVLGGYPRWPLFEDVAIIEKIIQHQGKAGLRRLPGPPITTSAARYEKDGFFKRGLANLRLLRRYKSGESPERLQKDYL